MMHIVERSICENYAIRYMPSLSLMPRSSIVPRNPMHKAPGVKAPATSFLRNRAQSVWYQPISRSISRSGPFWDKLAPGCGRALMSRKPLQTIRRDTIICRFAHSLVCIIRNISGISYTTNLLGLRIPYESSLSFALLGFSLYPVKL